MLRNVRSLRLSEEAITGLLLVFGGIAAAVNATVADWAWWARLGLALGLFLGLLSMAYGAWEWYRSSRRRM